MMAGPLEVNEQTTMVIYVDYYFGDKYNHFVLADKHALLSMLPECKKQVKEYFRTNDVDFQNKNNLEKLFYFLNSNYSASQ
jgi:hypothetical protein